MVLGLMPCQPYLHYLTIFLKFTSTTKYRLLHHSNNSVIVYAVSLIIDNVWLMLTLFDHFWSVYQNVIVSRTNRSLVNILYSKSDRIIGHKETLKTLFPFKTYLSLIDTDNQSDHCDIRRNCKKWGMFHKSHLFLNYIKYIKQTKSFSTL